MDNLFNVENNIYTNLIIPSDFITQNKYFIDINYKNRSRLSCSIDEIVTIKKYAAKKPFKTMNYIPKKV